MKPRHVRDFFDGTASNSTRERRGQVLIRVEP